MRSEVIRFALVLILGLGLDIAIAAALLRFSSASLPVAAAAGFCAGAATNYLLHEAWTFRYGRIRLSLTRALRYLLALGAGLVARVGTVAAITAVTQALPVMAVLLMGIGVSFVVNFTVSRFFVFRRSHLEQDPHS